MRFQHFFISTSYFFTSKVVATHICILAGKNVAVLHELHDWYGVEYRFECDTIHGV